MSTIVNSLDSSEEARLDRLRPICFTDPKEFDDKMFAHIHFDHRMTGTLLEGNYFKNTTACVKKMLKHLTQEGNTILPRLTRDRILNELVKVEAQFESLTRMEDLYEKYGQELIAATGQHKIQDGNDVEENYIAPLAKAARDELESTGEVCLPGGWKSEYRGHAMCYQIKLETEGPHKGSYVFLVYNTGSGIQYHQETTGLVDKRTPLMAYRIPPSDNNLDNLEKFIKALATPQIKPLCRTAEEVMPSEWDQERLYDADRLYTEVIPKIFSLGAVPIDLKKKENKKQYTAITTLGQMGGSCSMRVLMPFLHVALKGEAFQQFLYQFRVQTIADYYRLHKHELHLPKVKRKLQKSVKGLGKTLHKMMNRKKDKVPVLTEAQVKEGLDWVRVIEKEIEKVILTEKAGARESVGVESKETQENRNLRLKGPLDNSIETQQKVKPKETAEDSEKSRGTEKKTLQENQETQERKESQDKKESRDIQKRIPPKMDINAENPNPLEHLKSCYQALADNDRLGLGEAVVNETEKLFLSFPLDYEKAKTYWSHLSTKEAKEALTLMQGIQRIYGKQCSRLGGFPLARQQITSETARLNAVFIVNRAFNDNPKLARLSDSALNNVTIFRDVECVTFDPVLDQRIVEIEKMKADFTKSNKKHPRNYDDDSDYFDLNYIDSHLSQENQKMLYHRSQPSAFWNTSDRIRQNLYQFCAGSKYNVKPEDQKILDEYDTYLQFTQFSDECDLIKKSTLQYFEKADTRLTNESESRFSELWTKRVTRKETRGYHTIEVPHFRIIGDQGNHKTGYEFQNHPKLTADSYKMTIPQFLNMDNTYVLETLFDGAKDSNQRILEAIRREESTRSDIKSRKPKDVKLRAPKRILAFTRHLASEGRTITTNDFISGNFELFNDQNYSSFVLMNFFTPELINTQLTRNPEFARSIVNTMSEGLAFHTNGEEISEGGLFFLSLSYHMLHYIKLHPKAKEMKMAIEKLEALDKVILDHIQHYQEQLTQRDSNKEALQTKLGQLYIILGLRKGLDKEAPISRLEAKIFLKSRMLSTYLIKTGENRILSSLDTRNSDELQPRLDKFLSGLSESEREDLIKESLLEMYPYMIPQGSIFTIRFPEVVITHPNLKAPLQLDLLQGSLLTATEQQKMLPNEIQWDTGYMALFGRNEREVTLSTHDELSKIYTLVDKPSVDFKPKEYFIQSLNTGPYTKTVNIYTKPGRETQLFQYGEPPNIKIPTRFKSKNLFTVWGAEDSFRIKTYYYLDKERNARIRVQPIKNADGSYPVSGIVSYQCVELNTQGEETGYRWVPDQKSRNDPLIESLYKNLERFEHRENIEIWQVVDAKTGDIHIKVKLPRYDLEWNAVQGKDKPLEFVFAKDPKYQLLLTAKNSIQDFSHTLLMGDAKDNQIVLVPKQDFMGTKVEVDDYLQLSYNVEGKRHGEKEENSESYYQFKRVKEKPKIVLGGKPKTEQEEPPSWVLKGNTPAHYLQLTYIHLGNRNTVEALNALKQCKKIKGTPEEIDLIEKIMTDIPSHTLTPDEILRKSQVQDPETCTVRLYAAELLARQKQTSFNKMSLEKTHKQKQTKTSTAVEPTRNLEDFYQKGFLEAARNIYRQYHRRMEMVSEDMRMPESDEALFLASIYPEKHFKKEGEKDGVKEARLSPIKTPEEVPLFIINRKKLLGLNKAGNQKKILLKKRDKEGLSPNEVLELKNLEEQLAAENHIQKRTGKWKTRTITVDPPIWMPNEGNRQGYISLLFMKNEDLHTRKDNSGNVQYYKYISSYKFVKNRNKDRDDSKYSIARSEQRQPDFTSEMISESITIIPLTLDKLDYSTRIEDFIFAFKDIYGYCLPPIKPQDDPIRLRIQNYAERAIRTAASLSKMDEKEKTQYGLCQILLHVLKEPQKQWPKEIKPESLSDIRLICQSIHESTPVQCQAYSIVSSEKPATTNVVNLDNVRLEVKRRAETQAVFARSDPSDQFDPLSVQRLEEKSVALELGLKPLMEELDTLQTAFQKDAENWQKEIKIESDKDPFLERQRIRFELDVAAGRRKNQLRSDERVVYRKHLLPEKHKALKKTLDDECTKNQESLEKTLQSILQKANIALTGSRSSLETQARILRGELKPLEWKHLLGFYLQGDKEHFRRNTLLSEVESDHLYAEIHQFLVDATENQHRSRISSLLGNLIDKPDPKSDEYQSNLIKLGEQISMRRAYDPTLHPEMLVFEFKDEKRIRSDQYALLKKLLDKNDKGLFNNEIVQMIMGGGKSKILLPLLALRKTDGTNLSIIEVPEALFETNYADLSSVTEEVFGKTAHRLLFNRDTHRTAEELKQVRLRLDYIIANQEYLVTTAESVQSIKLKYLELLNKEQITEDAKDQINELEKILTLFKMKGDVLVDECDTVLDPKRELNYTQGEKQNIDPDIFSNILKIYQLLKKTNLDGVSLEDMMMGTKTIPTEEGRETAIRQLAEALIQDPESPLSQIMKLYSEADKAVFLKYLVADKDIQSVPKIVMDRNPEHKKIIGLVKGELKQFITCLRRKYKENYGFPVSVDYEGSIEIAIPYVSSNTPNEKAQFGSIYEIINYTIQAQKQKSVVKLSLIQQFIQGYKDAAEKERLLSGARLKLDDTLHGRAFTKLTGESLESITLADTKRIQELQAVFSKNPKIHDEILLKYVLPDIKQYGAILRSNPIDHAAQFRTRQGFTGTAWNVACYHYLFNFDEKLSLGIDGQTIDLLTGKMEEQRAQKQAPIKACPEGTTESVIRQLVNNHPKTHEVHAIIDVGGLFKNSPNNEQVARVIATLLGERPGNGIKHVLFFNEQNELCAISLEDPANVILIGSSLPEVIFEKIGSHPHQCFTYYSQRHTTGTDIKQPPNAIGITTIDADTKARDLWQGVMRFRDFANQQKIEIALSKAALSSRPENHEWRTEDIVRLVQSNQDAVLGDFHLSTSLDNMDAIIRAYCIDRIMQAETLEDKVWLRQKFSRIIDIMMKEEPFLKFGGVESDDFALNILSNHMKQCLTLFDDLVRSAKLDIGDDRIRIVRELAVIQERALKICKKSYKNIHVDEGRSVEVDKAQDKEAEANRAIEAAKAKEKEKEKEKERERQREQERMINEARQPHIPIMAWGKAFPIPLHKGVYVGNDSKNIEVHTLNEMVSTASNELSWKFSESLLVSENFQNAYYKQQNKMDAFVKPVNYTLVIQEPDTHQLKMMLVAPEEAEEFVRYLDEHSETLRKEGYEAMVVTPNNEPWAATSKLNLHPHYADMMEQVRFVNGDIHLLLRDKQYNWIYDQEVSKLKFLENHILPNHSSQPLFLSYQEQVRLEKDRIRQSLIDARTLLFESFKTGDSKASKESFNTLMDLLKGIQNPTLREAILKQEKEAILEDAVKFGQTSLLSIVMGMPYIYGDGKDFRNGFVFKAGIQYYQPEVFKVLLEEERFWPRKQDPEAVKSILTTLLTSNNLEAIAAFLKQAIQKYGQTQVETQLLSVLSTEKLNTKMTTDLFKVLGQVIEKPDEKQWSEYFKAISESDPDRTFALLTAWNRDPDNAFLKRFRVGQFEDESSLLKSISPNNKLFFKLLFHSDFTIDERDTQSWIKLICYFRGRMDLLQPSIQHIQKHFTKEALKRLIEDPRMLETMKIIINEDAYGYEKIKVLLDFCLHDDNVPLWQFVLDTHLEYAKKWGSHPVLEVLSTIIDKRVEFSFTNEAYERYPFLSQGIVKSYLQKGKTLTIERHLSRLDFSNPIHAKQASAFLEGAIDSEKAWPLVLDLFKKGALLTNPVTLEKVLNHILTKDKSLTGLIPYLLKSQVSDINPNLTDKLYQEIQFTIIKNPTLLADFLKFPSARSLIRERLNRGAFLEKEYQESMRIILQKFGAIDSEVYRGDILEYAAKAITENRPDTIKILFEMGILTRQSPGGLEKMRRLFLQAFQDNRLNIGKQIFTHYQIKHFYELAPVGSQIFEMALQHGSVEWLQFLIPMLDTVTSAQVQSILKTKNTDLIKLFIEKDPRAANERLLEAISEEDKETIALLLDNGCLPDGLAVATNAYWGKPNWSHIPLYKAIRAENIELVELLIEKGASTQTGCTDEHGHEQNILSYAYQKRNVPLLKALLKSPPEKYESSDLNQTLMNAINEGDTEIVSLLLQKAIPHRGHLKRAINKRFPDIIKLLEQQKSVQEQLEYSKDSELSMALDPRMYAIENSRAVAFYMAEKGASWEFTDFQNVILQRQYPEVLEQMLRHNPKKISVDSPVDQGKTALQKAIENDDAEMVAVLLNAGANPNVERIIYTSSSSITPTENVVIEEEDDIFSESGVARAPVTASQPVLFSGPSRFRKDDEDDEPPIRRSRDVAQRSVQNTGEFDDGLGLPASAYTPAIDSGERPPDDNPDYGQSHYGQAETKGASELESQAVDDSSTSSASATASTSASGSSESTPVRAHSPSLLFSGGPVSGSLTSGDTLEKTVPDPKDTLLMVAIRQNQTSIAQLLIRSGADLTAVNGAGETPLKIAQILRLTPIVQAITEKLESDNTLKSRPPV